MKLFCYKNNKNLALTIRASSRKAAVRMVGGIDDCEALEEFSTQGPSSFLYLLQGSFLYAEPINDAPSK